MTHLLVVIVALGVVCFVPFSRADCFQEAGQRYHVDPLLLYAIAKVESRLDPAARNQNKDGTYDIGLMQINSRHLQQLAQYGIDEHALQTQPCTSVMTGAWILAQFVRQLGYDWTAVGAYNAGARPERDPVRKRYALQVWRYYSELLVQRQRSIEPSAERFATQPELAP